jgi:hypothetical protein
LVEIFWSPREFRHIRLQILLDTFVKLVTDNYQPDWREGLIFVTSILNDKGNGNRLKE